MMVPRGRTEEESNTSCLSPRPGAAAVGPVDSESASSAHNNDQQHVPLHECDRSRRRRASLLLEENDLQQQRLEQQQQQQHLSMYHKYRCGNYNQLSLSSKMDIPVDQGDDDSDYDYDYNDEDITSTCQPPSVAATSTTSYCSSSFSLSSSSNYGDIGGGGSSSSGSSSIDESFRSLHIEQPQQSAALSSTTTTARTSRSPSPSPSANVNDDGDGDDNGVQIQQQAPMVRLVEDDEDMKNPALVGVLKDLQKAQDEHVLTKDCHAKLAEAWNALGLVRLHMQKDPSAALTCHEHALTILREKEQIQVQQYAQLSSASASASDIYDGRYERRQQQINENQALTLHDMGQCFERLKDSTAALERYNDALQILTVSLDYANDHYRVLSTQRAIDRVQKTYRVKSK